MRDAFPGFYRPTNEEFDQMWRDGLFVVDANVLLNLYRYSRETREELLRLLGALGDRLWVPHQVAHEFLRRRLGAIHQQRRKAQELRAHLAEVRGSIEGRVRALTRDPSVEPGEHLDKLLGAFSELEGYLEGQADGSVPLSNSPQDDEVWAAVEGLLDERMGEGYAEEKLREVEEEWKERKERKVPPGFKDDGPGDLILWRQTMAKAGEARKPVVFVTDDRKEDWWWIEHGRTVGPRRHLVEEMRREAGVAFHMYTPDRFMRYAAQRLQQEVSDEAISEAEELGTGNAEWDSFTHSLAQALPQERRVDIRMLALSDRERAVLREYLLSGRSVDGVAEELAISTARARRVLHKLRGELRTGQEREKFVDETGRWGATAEGSPLDDLLKTEELLRVLAAASAEDRRAIFGTLTPPDVSKLLTAAVVGETDERALSDAEADALIELLSDLNQEPGG